MRVSFENYCPRLKPGKLIPQGRRLIYETIDGRRQIVLPVEVADVILLSTGNYNMRQIIEKIFKRKGSVHFRTLFRTIHQLRDHGFLENGEELESHSWWTSPLGEQKLVHDLPLLGRRHGPRPHPMSFYFLSLAIISLAGASLVEVPWPPLEAPSMKLHPSVPLSLLLLWLLNSALLSFKNILKVGLQIMLTGTVFGVHLRLAPWGVFLRTLDEPIFLITNRLFLTLYHLGLIVSPLLFSWPLSAASPTWHLAAVSLAVLQIGFDLSPFTRSEFMRSVRALMSVSDSDLVAGYLRDDSLLALLAPVGKPSISLKLRRCFMVYLGLWSGLMLSLVAHGCRDLSGIAGDSFEMAAWLGFAFTGLWIGYQLWGQVGHGLIGFAVKHAKYLVARIQSYRDSNWSKDRLMNTLLQLPIFGYFSTGLLEKVLAHSELIRCRVGSRLITQGEMGRHLFVLLDGGLAVERSSFTDGRRPLTALRPVSIFGEMAIVEESERTADVIARENSTVLKIPATILRAAAGESQFVGEIEAFCNAIIVNQFFTSAPMFRDLPEEAVHDISMRSSLRKLTTGEILIRQGEPGRSFFMILRGSVEVSIDGQSIKRIKQGGFVGEIAIIADIPRTATVRAHETTIVMEMAASSFWEVLSQNIELAMFIEAVGESRLHEDIQSGVPDSELSRSAG